ncbi:MAG: TraB/GumN family protein [Hyphomicrobiaceae bacterium]
MAFAAVAAGGVIMAFGRVRSFLSGLALVVAAWAPAQAEPIDASTCRGHDVLPELYASVPGARERVQAAASRTPNGEALLWRISRAGIKPSYLFGTIHLSDERVTVLPRSVVEAMDAAKLVALEVADVSPKAFGVALAKLQDRVVFTDGRSLASMLDTVEMASVHSSLSAVGFPPAAQDRLRPWFVSMMLSVSKCERKRLQTGLQPLDLQIGARARKRGLAVVSLETLEGQLLAMASIPEGDQLSTLKATLKTKARTADAVESMLQRYLAREMAKVLPMQAEMMRAAGVDPSAMKSLQHALLTVRNPRMRDAALPILVKGEAFIAVGALHLIGEDGLVALLREAGYEVTPVD